MALLAFGTAPPLLPKSHRCYAPWLERRCYDRACAYCTEHARALQIDHVVPASLAPERSKDPTNLLPACSVCNGPLGKWDYHPAKTGRKKCPGDTHGYPALDPRVDDVAILYNVRHSGELEVNDGEQYLRALWNRDVLFRLNRPKLVAWRKQSLEIAEAARTLADSSPRPATPSTEGNPLSLLIGLLSQRLLFFELFELPLHEHVRARAEQLRSTAVRSAA